VSITQETVPDEALKRAKILAVDDDPQSLRLVERLLADNGFTAVRTVSDPRSVAPLYAEIHPDLILLDLHMPTMSGFEVMDELRALVPSTAYLPIIAITSDTSPETKRQALASGAKDFLTKPLDETEVLLRIRNHLETRHLYRELAGRTHNLEATVRDRTRELHDTQVEILDRLAAAAEYRDFESGEHTRRVGRMAGLIAAALGLLDAEVDLIRHAAPLHDLGKIGIPDKILLKPGTLTRKEFEVMKDHTRIGASMLSGGRSEIVILTESIALSHHESWDGKGYPLGLAGERIPQAGRIVGLADSFDALISDRPYRKALQFEDAMESVRSERGTRFEPRVLDAFLMAVDYDSLFSPGTKVRPE